VVLRDRQILNEDGVIAVSLAVDGKRALVAGPEIATRGVIYVKENEALLEALRAAVIAALGERGPDEPSDREAIAARVRSTVRQFVTQRFQRKPVVLPMVLEV
jgi:ribonuclease J